MVPLPAGGALAAMADLAGLAMLLPAAEVRLAAPGAPLRVMTSTKVPYAS